MVCLLAASTMAAAASGRRRGNPSAAVSTSASGVRTRGREPASTSRACSRWRARRARDLIGPPPSRTMGAEIRTTSWASGTSRSAWVDDDTAPSTYLAPSMTFGWKSPGTAEVASSASPSVAGVLSRPNTTVVPSSSLTLGTQSWAGHSWLAANLRNMKVGKRPAGRSPTKAVATPTCRTQRTRPGATGCNARNGFRRTSEPMDFIRSRSSSVGGAEIISITSSVGVPAKRVAAIAAPADVPTTRSALAGSRSMASRTPCTTPR